MMSYPEEIEINWSEGELERFEEIKKLRGQSKHNEPRRQHLKAGYMKQDSKLLEEVRNIMGYYDGK